MLRGKGCGYICVETHLSVRFNCSVCCGGTALPHPMTLSRLPKVSSCFSSLLFVTLLSCASQQMGFPVLDRVFTARCQRG